MATDNLLITFDLSDFRNGVKALLLCKHGGDTATAIQCCSDFLWRFSQDITEKPGSFSFADAVKILYDYWGELLFSEDDVDDGEVPQCMIDIAEEFGLKWNSSLPGYGLAFTENKDDFYSLHENLSECSVLCQGHFKIFKDKPPVLEGWFFNTDDADDVDADDYEVLDECFARLVDCEGDIRAVGAREEGEFDRDKYTDDEWSFLSGFFTDEGKGIPYDLDDFEELGYLFRNDEIWMVNDEDGNPSFLISGVKG